MENSYQGFRDPIWMAKAVIAQARGEWVKVAVVDLLDLLGNLKNAEEGTELSVEEIIDRLVQVSVLGSYEGPHEGYGCSCDDHDEEYEEEVATLNSEGVLEFTEELSEEDEDLIEEFSKLLEGLWGGENEPDED